MKTHRYALLAVAFGFAGALFAHRGVEAQPAAAPRSLTVATLAPPGSTWMRVLESWNREIRRRTNGTLQLRIYPGGVQGDESEVVRKVRAGRLDGGIMTAVGLGQIHRPSLAFQIPGMFSNYQELDAARVRTHDTIVQAYNAANFVFLDWGDVGFSKVFSRSAVRTPTDLRGTRPYVWRDDRVMPALFSEVGATAVPLQLPEVLSALQTDRVNAFVTSPVAAVSLQWSSRATHMTDVNVGLVVGATVFGKRQFDSLSPEQQTALRETALQFHQLLRTNLRRDEGRAMSSFAGRGINVISVTAAERAQWNRVFDATRARLTGQVADAAFIARIRRP
ncbi:MAG: TRAP transporter substrate-binding protein DctP [Polyangiales bacterium]